MKIGFGLPNFGLMGTRDIILTLARETEKLGYDSLWAGERLMNMRPAACLFPNARGGLWKSSRR